MHTDFKDLLFAFNAGALTTLASLACHGKP